MVVEAGKGKKMGPPASIGKHFPFIQTEIYKLNQQEGKITMTGFIGDQTPNKHSLNFWTRFLNQDTAVLEGTEKIARKLNQPVVFVNMRKVKRGHYHAEFYDLCSDPQSLEPGELTRMHIRMLERFIREEPAYWLWSHRRWKHKRVVVA